MKKVRVYLLVLCFSMICGTFALVSNSSRTYVFAEEPEKQCYPGNPCGTLYTGYRCDKDYPCDKQNNFKRDVMSSTCNTLPPS
jgi:hypothetical protein